MNQMAEKVSHLTKHNFSTTDRDVYHKNFRFYSGRRFQRSLKISPKYFHCFKNYSFYKILFRGLLQNYAKEMDSHL